MYEKNHLAQALRTASIGRGSARFLLNHQTGTTLSYGQFLPMPNAWLRRWSRQVLVPVIGSLFKPQKPWPCWSCMWGRFWRFTAEDTLIHTLPVFHTHGLFVATNVTLMAGGDMIFLAKFETGLVLDYMPEATTLMGGANILHALAANSEFS